MTVQAASAPVLLNSGDRLTREEFHRRYSARPDIRRAELVEGVAYVRSPNSYVWHDEQVGMMVAWVGVYASGHASVWAGNSASIFLDGRNEVQPDAFLMRLDPSGPGPRLNDRGYIEGAPQLVVEVAASSVSYDLHDKKEAYRRNGVRESIVWRVLDHAVDRFRFRDGQYVLVEPDQHGVIESETFPGLLNVTKLLAGDLAGVLPELEAS